MVVSDCVAVGDSAAVRLSSRSYPLQLSEVYGQNICFNPRLPYFGNPVMPRDEFIVNFLTGAYLGMAGNLTVLCHESVLRPSSVHLLAAAGLSLPEVVSYQDYRAYQSLLATAPPGSVVYQHVHPDEEAPVSSYRVPRTLLSLLNNKANAATLVPPRAMPRRITIDAVGAAITADDMGYPCVLKIVSDDSVGGGYGVRICQSVEEVQQAANELAVGGDLVLEEFFDIHRNWCLNFVVDSTGVAEYLGAAEQITDPEGKYRGNILASDGPNRLVDIGREVMAQAVQLGYRGFAGMDIVETTEGRDFVIDLNFRLNGSTPAVLLRQTGTVNGETGPMLYRTWHTADFTADVLTLLIDLAEESSFIPVSSRFPGQHEPQRCLVSGVLVADDHDELNYLVGKLNGAGLR